MILTWVNGKRPLRPFTSPSHWPLMFIRVTLTMSPTWGKKGQDVELYKRRTCFQRKAEWVLKRPTVNFYFPGICHTTLAFRGHIKLHCLTGWWVFSRHLQVQIWFRRPRCHYKTIMMHLDASNFVLFLDMIHFLLMNYSTVWLRDTYKT